MLEVTQSSTAASMVALYAIHNGATGAGLTGYGLQAIKTGAGAGTNVAGYFSATGATGANYSIIVPSGGGYVGFGTSSPVSPLDVTMNGDYKYILYVHGSNPGLAINNTNDPATTGLYKFISTGNSFQVLQNTAAGGDFSTNTSIMTWLNGGNVGIGTTNPGAKLEIAGQIKITGGSPAASRVLVSDAAGLGSWSTIAGAGGVTTSCATTNYVPKMTSSSNIGCSQIFDNGTNVGVGTATPLSVLHSNGTLTVGNGATAGSIANVQITTGGASPINNRLTFGTDGTGWKFAIAKNQAGTVSELMTIQDNGNVGIGTTSPNYPLAFAAANGAKIDLFQGGNYGFGIQANVLQIFSPVVTTRVGIGYGTSGSFTEAMSVIGSNVGIGTAAPSDKLEISGGDIKITNTGGAYNGMLYSGDVNWGFKIQRTAATDDYNVRMSYYPSGTGTRRAGIYNVNSGAWVLYADQNVTPNIVMNNIASVGIGMVPSGTYKVEVNGTLKTTGIKETSDIRWKKNILTLDSALFKLKELRGVSYYWRADEFKDKNFETTPQIGLIAQEVEKIFPQLVGTDKGGFKSVEYSKMVAVLIEAIKEQQKIIEGQRSEVENVKAENKVLSAKYDLLINALIEKGVIDKPESAQKIK